jgi:hypothetical protein
MAVTLVADDAGPAIGSVADDPLADDLLDRSGVPGDAGHHRH